MPARDDAAPTSDDNRPRGRELRILILRYIERCCADPKRRPPTVRGVARRFGIGTSGAAWHLNWLRDRGEIDWDSGAIRSIYIPGEPCASVPVVGMVDGTGSVRYGQRAKRKKRTAFERLSKTRAI